jgi:hypothetical protein|tara:strand:+ start:978 stop:1268 length:291 start_codon:yes stop_codon:yes gene_type:complete
MKLKEMIERVRQHHPDMGEVEIIRSLNDALNDFGSRTEIIESVDQFNIANPSGDSSFKAGQRVYPLKKHIIKIKAVDYDGKAIKKLLNRPIERDLV